MLGTEITAPPAGRKAQAGPPPTRRGEARTSASAVRSTPPLRAAPASSASRGWRAGAAGQACACTPPGQDRNPSGWRSRPSCGRPSVMAAFPMPILQTGRAAGRGPCCGPGGSRGPGSGSGAIPGSAAAARPRRQALGSIGRPPRPVARGPERALLQCGATAPRGDEAPGRGQGASWRRPSTRGGAARGRTPRCAAAVQSAVAAGSTPSAPRPRQPYLEPRRWSGGALAWTGPVRGSDASSSSSSSSAGAGLRPGTPGTPRRPPNDIT